jgi:hypothetical protein
LRRGGKCDPADFSAAGSRWAAIAGAGKFLPGEAANTSTFHQMADAKRRGKPGKTMLHPGTQQGEQR